MTKMINKFIQGLESSNLSPNELIIVLDLLKTLDGKPRTALIHRLTILTNLLIN